jgi:uncharacterized damage-inducible protein DinB
MFQKSYPIYIFIILFAFSGLTVAGDHHEKGMEVPGFRGEFMGQVQFIEGRLTQLLQAIPAEDYDWRPAAGVRSIGEVYMHAALANYYFIKSSGQQVPVDINLDLKPQDWEKTASGKEAITEVLKRSFTDLRTAAKNITESDLEKTVTLFGMEMSMRNFMVSSLNHLHEHLGQSIAYARMNSITPPWTTEQQKAAAK